MGQAGSESHKEVNSFLLPAKLCSVKAVATVLSSFFWEDYVSSSDLRAGMRQTGLS